MAAPLLHHVIEGNGPNVVLLHPVGLDLTFWDDVAALLRSRCQLLRLDLAGHGRSPPPGPAHALEDYADDVHRVLTATGFAPAAIVGLSFGGMVAQALALRHPADASHLIACGCPGEFPEAARTGIAERGATAEAGGMAAVIDATLQRWFTPEFLGDARVEAVRQRLACDDVGGWAAAWRAISRLATLPLLDRIAVPTLCIAGERDGAVPPAATEAIARRIKGARYVVLQGAPHMMHIEQPQALAAAIADFISPA